MSPAGRNALYVTAAFAASFSMAAWVGAGKGAPTLSQVAEWIGLAEDAAAAAPEIARAPETDEPKVDPFALAEDIVSARDGFAREGDDSILAATQARYLGREVVWEVRYVAPFCTAPDRCAVVPFDHARLDARFLQGWMPRLSLTAEEHRTLGAHCAHHDRCVVTLSAEISDLVLSPDEPTSVTLSDVRVLSSRDEREGESWMRRLRGDG